MENKYNCDSYDCGYCYYLSRPLTDEEDDRCEDKCCAYGKKEDFIKYAKEVYDIDINIVPSDEPDTFDTFFGTIEPKHKYVIVYGDASTDVIESNGYPNITQLHNVVAIVKCE